MIRVEHEGFCEDLDDLHKIFAKKFDRRKP